MEQRIQSLVCAISLVRRVLDRQKGNLPPSPDALNQEAENGVDRHGAVDLKVPLRVIPTASAVKHIVSYLRTVPRYLRDFIAEQTSLQNQTLKPAQKHVHKRLKNEGETSKMVSERVPDDASAHFYKAFDLEELTTDVTHVCECIERILPSADLFITTSPTQGFSDKTNPHTSPDKILFLDGKPLGFAWLRKVSLQVRDLVMTIEKYSTSTAR
jgi:hypothetical protein